MATLEGKKVAIIGGSSGIGYAVAKASLLSQAEHVLIASSTTAKVESAVSRLLEEPALQRYQPGLKDCISGDVVDLKDAQSIAAFFDRIGEIDHLVLTSGGISGLVNFREDDLNQHKGLWYVFDLKFWGSAISAQKAKIRTGGSITFSIGGSLFKPKHTWSLIVSAIGALDALTRALAVELAPLRVNVVSPGFVDTELWDDMPKEAKEQLFAEYSAKLPLRHIASPDEIAEAYLFLMKLVQLYHRGKNLRGRWNFAHMKYIFYSKSVCGTTLMHTLDEDTSSSRLYAHSKPNGHMMDDLPTIRGGMVCHHQRFVRLLAAFKPLQALEFVESVSHPPVSLWRDTIILSHESPLWVQSSSVRPTTHPPMTHLAGSAQAVLAKFTGTTAVWSCLLAPATYKAMSTKQISLQHPLGMATLEGKKIVVIGGSSGIGYAVAKASLLSQAEHVLIASSTAAKVESGVSRLLAEPSLQSQQSGLKNRISGDVLDLTDAQAITTFFDKVGELDHLVITSGGTPVQADFRGAELGKYRDAFDLKFWGHAEAAQKAKIRTGGSITFSIGGALAKPPAGWSLVASVIGALDALSRALAVELAPIRVNVVSPGLVDTELWDGVPQEMKDKRFTETAEKLPVKHVAGPDEIAEAYLFLMKCNYITGERIGVDGGFRLV
ncbi:hypothetical protein NM688_g3792 [Phlebia brevispora]|uniref:Uncharacterized protein n=1 Tax=Phlebia brevispora TaxID=194682 RepID=A0ACC1T4T9_9APHY|nr:hypothetical protein NM688_g3792 [Phlebia brevispora]